jgi:L-ribulose-5-phosphate 4-epimerase
MTDKDLKRLKEKVFEANMKLARSGLVTSTFGNVSGIDRDQGIVAIKPSGIPYDDMKADDIVLVTIEGKEVEKDSPNPSSDTATHLELYKAFTDIGGVTHSHSDYATAFAQAKTAIPCLGTTHADYFYGPVPVSDVIEDVCIQGDYELETGRLIINTFKNRDYRSMKACLVACHGPFTWGKDAGQSVDIAISLEHIAILAYRSIMIKGSVKDIKKALLDKHYFRKHGSDAYYGQDS